MVPFLITFLAGCSTLIGYLFVYFKNHSNKVLISSLAFASGVMLLISIYDLIPSSFHSISSIYYLIPSFLICSVFVVGGILLSMTIDKYLPDNSYQDSYLYRVGMISMIAIILHNIPEGIATYLTTNHDLRLGITLAFALALHNIPEGMAISVPLISGGMSKMKAVFLTALSGFPTVLGAFIGYAIGDVGPIGLSLSLSFASGAMLYVVYGEIIPQALLMHRSKAPAFAIIMGLIVGLLIIYI